MAQICLLLVRYMCAGILNHQCLQKHCVHVHVHVQYYVHVGEGDWLHENDLNNGK